MNNDVKFSNVFTEEAKDIISKLLTKDPLKRLGYGTNGFATLKSHKFFNGIDFQKLKGNKVI
jgi:serine/threonine protein kinase